MTRLFQEYGPILVYVVVAAGLAIVILGLSMRVSTSNSDAEKLSAYECGFNPFDDARSRFDISFYRVAIRFIVFDREASFLFPQSVTLSEQGSVGQYTMVDFFTERVVGYIYAQKIGALEQE